MTGNARIKHCQVTLTQLAQLPLGLDKVYLVRKFDAPINLFTHDAK